MPERPKNEEELQRLEAVGVIRASRFVRRFAHEHERPSMDTVFQIHQHIFKDAWPEIAGKVRNVEIKITDSKHVPAHHALIPGLVNEAQEEFDNHVAKLTSVEALLLEDAEWSDEELGLIDQIVETAAWIHHKITFIHPFQDGNGRTARLAANLVLECYGLVGISIKVERENKNRYRQALAQIDKMEDFEPLKRLIYEGLVDRFRGVPMFFDKYSQRV